jgi:hypothetical protein
MSPGDTWKYFGFFLVGGEDGQNVTMVEIKA